MLNKKTPKKRHDQGCWTQGGESGAKKRIGPDEDVGKIYDEETDSQFAKSGSQEL